VGRTCDSIASVTGNEGGPEGGGGSMAARRKFTFIGKFIQMTNSGVQPDGVRSDYTMRGSLSVVSRWQQRMFAI
jgi:hypothetical protein